MPKALTTHREILRGLLLGAPIAAMLICVVWFVAVGSAPSAVVWGLAAIVLGVYVALAAVAWINSLFARRKRSSKPSE